MSKYSKQINPDKVSKDAKEVIFLEGFRGETLENVVDYWADMNINNLERAFTVTENPLIKDAIKVILRELEGNPQPEKKQDLIHLKELLKK